MESIWNEKCILEKISPEANKKWIAQKDATPFLCPNCVQNNLISLNPP